MFWRAVFILSESMKTEFINREILVFLSINLMEDQIKKYELYRLTSIDNELLKHHKINIEADFVLKSSNKTFKNAIETYYESHPSEKEITPILLIGEPCKFVFYSSVSNINWRHYVKINDLNNFSYYNIFMFIHHLNCPKLSWDHKVNKLLTSHVHSEVTKLYILIFQISEIYKSFGLCEDIMKYTVKFLL